MDKKVITKEQLQRRIDRAVIHIDRTKDTKEIYFDDKGLRLIVCDDFCIIATNFHRHVFNKLTSSGFSNPYLYTSLLVDMAFENDCTVKNEKGEITNSYVKLIKNLSEKEEQREYVIAMYFDWYLNNIYNPLYSIGEDSISAFLVNFKYLCNIALNHLLLSEHKDGMTNKQFVEEYKKLIDEYYSSIDERKVFEAISDEEAAKREMEAMAEQESEELVKKQSKGRKKKGS